MAEIPEASLGYEIAARYGESPGVIPIAFSQELTERNYFDPLPLIQEIQRRWTGQPVDAMPMQWVEFPTASVLPTGTATATEYLWAALPAAPEMPPVVKIQESGTAARIVPPKKPAASSPASEPASRPARTDALPGTEEKPAQVAQPVVVQVRDTAPRLRPVPPLAEPPSAGGEAPPVSAQPAKPVVHVREAQPKLVRQAWILAQNAAASAAPASSPRTWSEAAIGAVPAVSRRESPATVQAPPPPVTVVREMPAPAGTESPAKAAPPVQIDSERIADRAMYKILRRLAIERERRGGRQWP